MALVSACASSTPGGGGLHHRCGSVLGWGGPHQRVPLDTKIVSGSPCSGLGRCAAFRATADGARTHPRAAGSSGGRRPAPRRLSSDELDRSFTRHALAPALSVLFVRRHAPPSFA